jgi:2-methylcitrate dehydratase PrpD
MGTTEKMAKFVVDFDFKDLPARGIEQAKISMLDSIGTALAGGTGPVGAMIVDFVNEMGGSSQARVIGKGIKTSVLNAALANGTLAHADDYDDQGGFGHAGVILTPTALALGEYLKLPGKKLLEAYAVGFEVAYKLSRSMGEVQGHGCFHSTSLLGTLAAAAESAKLLGLDVAQTRRALGIASSLASGLVQNFGTYTKPLHAGHAARNGITAAMLAKRGFTGDPDILEGGKGFIYVFGQEQADIKRTGENIGKPMAIAEHGVTIKAWPCCAGNHEALTAIFQLINQYDIKPEEVDAIEVATASKPPGPVIRTRPQKGFEGKFSMQYSMATALVDRKVDLYSYTDEKLSRPIVQQLIKKVNHVWHEDYADKPARLQGDARFAVVTLRLKDGRVVSERRDVATRTKLKGDEIYAKYRDNAKIGGLEKSKIDISLKLMINLETVNDVTDVMNAVS